MVALLSEEPVVASFVLPHESLQILDNLLLLVLLNHSLIKPLLLGNGVAVHGLLVLNENALLDLGHDPHL